MAEKSEMSIVGYVTKTHGVKGEMNVTLNDPSLMCELVERACYFFDIDGIYVPFYVKSVRPRGEKSALVMFDDVDSPQQAARFVNRSLYMEFYGDEDEDEQEADPMYAEDFIGFVAYDRDREIGVIEGVDSSTENYLFVIRDEDSGNRVLVPIVNEFIVSYNIDPREIRFDLPEGLLDL